MGYEEVWSTMERLDGREDGLTKVEGGASPDPFQFQSFISRTPYSILTHYYKSVYLECTSHKLALESLVHSRLLNR
jgi:hypothetical protein